MDSSSRKLTRLGDWQTRRPAPAEEHSSRRILRDTDQNRRSLPLAKRHYESSRSQDACRFATCSTLAPHPPPSLFRPPPGESPQAEVRAANSWRVGYSAAALSAKKISIQMPPLRGDSKLAG